jgi:hypothetical protein
VPSTPTARSSSHKRKGRVKAGAADITKAIGSPQEQKRTRYRTTSVDEIPALFYHCGFRLAPVEVVKPIPHKGIAKSGFPRLAGTPIEELLREAKFLTARKSGKV